MNRRAFIAALGCGVLAPAAVPAALAVEGATFTRRPMVMDLTNGALYVHNGTVWRKVTAGWLGQKGGIGMLIPEAK